MIERVEADLCRDFPGHRGADPHRSRGPCRRAGQRAGRDRRVRQAGEQADDAVCRALLARRCLRRPPVRRQPGRGHAARRMAARRRRCRRSARRTCSPRPPSWCPTRPARPTGSCAGSRPTVEIRLCGHATLASGSPARARRRRAGHLPHPQGRACSKCARWRRRATSWRCRRSRPSRANGREAVAALGAEPLEDLAQPRPLQRVPVRQRGEVRALDARHEGARPRSATTSSSAPRRASATDIVSRVFVPGAGVDEDSVTGSAHARADPVLGRAAGPRQLHRAPGLGARRRPHLPARRRAGLARRQLRDGGRRDLLRLGVERDDLGQRLRPAPARSASSVLPSRTTVSFWLGETSTYWPRWPTAANRLAGPCSGNSTSRSPPDCG